MKRNLLSILSLLFLGMTANAQSIVYSNDFSTDPKSLMTPEGGLRDSSDGGNNLLIYAPQGHDEWATMELTFPTPLDFSISGNKPIVSIIASCDQTIAFEVRLVDDQGHASDAPGDLPGQPLIFNIIKDQAPKSFSYDFTGQFNDLHSNAGQPLGPVDSTKIVSIKFRINQGWASGQYSYHVNEPDAATYKVALSGIVKIDKLQIGTALTNGIATINANNNLSVYPNPSTGLVNVSLNNVNSDLISVTVANVLGQTIYSTQTTQSKLSVDLTGKNTGIYYISIKSSEGSTTKRVFLN